MKQNKVTTATQIAEIDRESVKHKIVMLMIEVQRMQKQYLQLYSNGATFEDSDVLTAFANLYTALQEEQNDQLAELISQEVGLNTQE